MIGFICIGFYPVLICENLRLKKIKINFARLLISCLPFTHRNNFQILVSKSLPCESVVEQ
jgi:hypothetical protein